MRAYAGAVVVASVLGLAASGCGVSSWVTAPESKYPISMSNGIRDENGDIVTKERKTVVGHYDKEYMACSMLWRLVSFTGDKDLSDDVNEKVRQSGGDAITNLSVESSGTVWTMLTILGIFPDCGHVKVHGEIVKVTPAGSPKDAPAPAPAAAAPTSGAGGPVAASE